MKMMARQNRSGSLHRTGQYPLETADNGGRSDSSSPLQFRFRICCLVAWMIGGPVCEQAQVAADEPVHSESTYSEPILDADQLSHWSLQPLRISVPPQVQREDLLRTPVDRFVQARLEQRGLSLQPPASSRELTRRASLVLTGLLPERTWESAAFSQQGFQEFVRQLLEQNAYGERWAQHWLDLARFAETDGYEHDKVRADAWKYRDWVIRELNKDLPYDRFIRMQIAGDLLSDDPADAIATHFCLAGPDMPDINLQDERRHTLLNEMTATVGEVVLGLQFACAQCHDHKYDPISTADFYRLRGVFEPAVVVQKNVSVSVLDRSQNGEVLNRVMLRGDFRRPGPLLQPAPPRCVQWEPSALGSRNRFDRQALAEWLTSAGNPLTARVIVNRVWQQHFGRGICDAASDLGVMGVDPTHPELLDWLANWFMQNGWSLKKLHALLLDSAVWQQRSHLDVAATAEEQAAWAGSLQEDPAGVWLSRFPRQRMEGEVVRDVLLQVSGQLNRQAGGPGVRPPLPAEIRATLLRDQWQESEDSSQHVRRSIYVFARRNLRYPIFEAFDRPAANLSCSRRAVSTTAPQSLYLLNSEFSGQISRRIAEIIRRQRSQTEEQVQQAFLTVLQRAPDERELIDAGTFLQQSGSGGLESLCLVLINTSEFIYVD